jgi:uncharacterized protein YabN with tetrapyrrole methylase and pyrophosphatase domain
MPKPPSRRLPPIRQVLEVMAALRAPDGCPWDREQDHRSLLWHAIEESYELMDAVEAGDDVELAEELGDLLLQVVFHAQLGRERQAFDFDQVCLGLVEKLVRRHPHVFGDTKVKDVAQVWANWERIKRAEKEGTRQARPSALDGVPRHLPGLMRAQKLVKKATKAGLNPHGVVAHAQASAKPATRREIAAGLFHIAEYCQDRGWSAEELLRSETRRRDLAWRREERAQNSRAKSK